MLVALVNVHEARVQHVDSRLPRAHVRFHFFKPAPMARNSCVCFRIVKSGRLQVPEHAAIPTSVQFRQLKLVLGAVLQKRIPFLLFFLIESHACEDQSLGVAFRVRQEDLFFLGDEGNSAFRNEFLVTWRVPSIRTCRNCFFDYDSLGLFYYFSRGSGFNHF